MPWQNRHFKPDNLLASIVQRALAQSPDERYASAKELADKLEEVLTSLTRYGAPVEASAKPSRYGWNSRILLLTGLIGWLTAAPLATQTANDAPLPAGNTVTADTNRSAEAPAFACDKPLATYQKTATDADLSRLVGCRLKLVSHYNDNGHYRQALQLLDALRPLYRNHPSALSHF